MKNWLKQSLEQGKQIEKLQENLKEVNKVSIKKLDENWLETMKWLKNKIVTLNADVGKVQGSVADTRTKMETNNERRRITS